VPDQDFFRKTGPIWRTVREKALARQGSDQEVADDCLRALSKTLRMAQGCPGFDELVEVLFTFQREQERQPLIAFAGELDLGEAFAVFALIERKHKGHRVTKVAARATKSLLVEMNTRDLCNRHLTSGLPQILAERVCSSLVDHHLFGRSRGHLALHAFRSFSAIRHWENGVRNHMAIGSTKIAKQLARDPSASRLRAPRRSMRSESTRDILGESL